jgi:hypothetical protein
MKLPDVRATVALPIDKKGRIGLARKKQAIHHDNGEIGYSLGLYNGWGGKEEPEDKTIWHVAKREAEVEGGVRIDIKHLKRVARVYFYVPDKENGGHKPFMDVTFFFLRKWEGEFTEGSEMGPPEFFHPHELPYGEMMPADRLLFERMLAGERGVYEVLLNGKASPPEIRKLDESLAIPWYTQLYVLGLIAWKKAF